MNGKGSWSQHSGSTLEASASWYVLLLMDVQLLIERIHKQ